MMKHVLICLVAFLMSSLIIQVSNASFFSQITKKFEDVDLLHHKKEISTANVELKQEKNPAENFPDPLFFDVKYQKTMEGLSLLYIYNDKSSSENRHIPPIIDLSYIVDSIFNMISNYDNTAEILLMLDALQYRDDININKQDRYGNTLLHYAIRYHNRPIFDKLLSTRSINPNICNNAYICPLHLAIYKNDIYEIQGLLIFGADIFYQNDRFEMPLVIAIKLNHREGVYILAKAYKERGISQNMVDYVIFAAKEQGYPILAHQLYLFFTMGKDFD